MGTKREARYNVTIPRPIWQEKYAKIFLIVFLSIELFIYLNYIFLICLLDFIWIQRVSSLKNKKQTLAKI